MSVSTPLKKPARNLPLLEGILPIKELKEQHIRLVFSAANEHVQYELDVSGVTEQIGQDAYYLDMSTVVETYRQKVGGGVETR